MKITIIAGARPNFMKIAPIIEAITNAKNDGKNISYRLVHTGQHYDKNMSDSFFTQLGIPEPHTNLECGGGSQAEQTGAIMIAFEKELLQMGVRDLNTNKHKVYGCYIAPSDGDSPTDESANRLEATNRSEESTPCQDSPWAAVRIAGLIVVFRSANDPPESQSWND